MGRGSTYDLSSVSLLPRLAFARCSSSAVFLPLSLLLFGILPQHLNPKPEIVGTDSGLLRRKSAMDGVMLFGALRFAADIILREPSNVRRSTFVALVTAGLAYPLRKQAEGTPKFARPSKSFGTFWGLFAAVQIARGVASDSWIVRGLGMAWGVACGVVGALEAIAMPREKVRVGRTGRGDRVEEREPWSIHLPTSHRTRRHALFLLASCLRSPRAWLVDLSRKRPKFRLRPSKF